MRKLFLTQELLAKCRAFLAGQAVLGMQKRRARSKVDEFKDKNKKMGRTPEESKLQPVSMKSIDDHVGFGMGINLSEPMSEIEKDGDKKAKVDQMFMRLGLFIASELQLRPYHTENHLWANNGANGASSKGFRVFKVHGMVSVDVDGEKVAVPVEVQLSPLESNVRKLMDGPTGTGEYKRRQIMDLIRRIHPTSVGGKEVFPQLIDPERLEQILSDVAQ